MPRIKSKPGGAANALPPANGEVLTLAEAAAYLRTAEEEVVRLIGSEGLPGRPVGGGWRFLKAALQDWLRAPLKKTGKQALLDFAGAWKDDPDIEEIVQDAYRRRGSPPPETGA